MAEQTTTNGSLDAEKLQRVEELLEDMKKEAQAANSSGDVFMLGVYNDILHVVSPIVVRAYARIERDTKAELNKAERAARKAEREKRLAAKQQAAS